MISGITFIHNGVSHDYCFEESIRSMLGVCNEVICVEASSTDETRARLDALQQADPRLHIFSAPWSPAPLVQATQTDWTMDLGNLARSYARYPYIAYVQADEVLHEADYPLILAASKTRHPITLNRYNFWMDPWHLIPHRRVCGHWLCRLAPRSTPVVWGSELLEPTGSLPSTIGLYHYGFLRHGPHFRRKAEVMLQNFVGQVDPVIYEVEKEGIQAMRRCWPASEDLPFTGTHPALAHQWLRERGYNPTQP